MVTPLKERTINLKPAILSQLGYGKDNAIKSKVIARRLELKDDRQVRIAIRELIHDGEPIASSVNPPYGYFIATDRAEAEEYISVTRSRIIEDCKRLRDFRRASREVLIPEQLVLI
jgi:hypothetical protein